MNNLPGHDTANKLGYSLSNYSADESSATYSKYDLDSNNTLFLTIYTTKYGLQAKLTAMIGVITLSTGKLGWPHPKFYVFEESILEILRTQAHYRELPDPEWDDWRTYES